VLRMKPLRSQLHCIGPDQQTTAEQVGSRHCVLHTTMTWFSQRTPTVAAQSAAAVAIAGLGVRKRSAFSCLWTLVFLVGGLSCTSVNDVIGICRALQAAVLFLDRVQKGASSMRCCGSCRCDHLSTMFSSFTRFHSLVEPLLCLSASRVMSRAAGKVAEGPPEALQAVVCLQPSRNMDMH
jgi:hypothetical protein